MTMGKAIVVIVVVRKDSQQNSATGTHSNPQPNHKTSGSFHRGQESHFVVMSPERWCKWWRQRQKTSPCCWRLPSAPPFLPLAFFSCLVALHTLRFGVTMNHGNWLCCRVSNRPAQGLTAWCVTAGRSSLLKGCAAGRPHSAALVQGHTASHRSEWSRITHVCRENKDVLFRLPATVPNLTVFTTVPPVFQPC